MSTIYLHMHGNETLSQIVTKFSTGVTVWVHDVMTSASCYDYRVLGGLGMAGVDFLADFFNRINPAKPKIWLILGLAAFCHEFQFSAEIRLKFQFCNITTSQIQLHYGKRTIYLVNELNGYNSHILLILQFVQITTIVKLRL